MYYLFIYYQPKLLLKANSKKDCVPKIKEFAISSKDEALIEFVNTVSDASITRLIFYTQIEDNKDDIIFSTFRKNRDGFELRSHLSFTYSGKNFIQAPEWLMRQYNFFKRKIKINKLLDESGKI